MIPCEPSCLTNQKLLAMVNAMRTQRLFRSKGDNIFSERADIVRRGLFLRIPRGGEKRICCRYDESSLFLSAQKFECCETEKQF
jgi:hypothetical protein